MVTEVSASNRCDGYVKLNRRDKPPMLLRCLTQLANGKWSFENCADPDGATIQLSEADVLAKTEPVEPLGTEGERSHEEP